MLYKYYKKTLLAFVILITLLVSLNAVAAEDIADNNVSKTLSDSSNVQLSDSSLLRDGGSNTVKIYVDSKVNVTGNGTQFNPYKTIKEAINVSNASSNVEIYLAEGVYNTTGDYGFTIDSNHKALGGSLSIIGAGDNKTVIDMLSKSGFIDMSSGSVFTIKGILFTHASSRIIANNNGTGNIVNCVFKNNVPGYGGAVCCEGITNITNCKFIDNDACKWGGLLHSSTQSSTSSAVRTIVENCYFKSTTSGAVLYTYGYVPNTLHTFKNCTVVNSNAPNIIRDWSSAEFLSCNFINCSSSSLGGVFQVSRINNLTIDDCNFINSSAECGGVFHINPSIENVVITNSKFINCSAVDQGAVIYIASQSSSGNLFLNNNSAIGCKAPNGDYLYCRGKIDIKSEVKLVFLNNETVNINSMEIPLTAKFTDDNGNSISGFYVQFFIDGNKITSSPLINGSANYSIKKSLSGNHTVSGYTADYSGSVWLKNITTKTAIINVNQLHNIDVYVANDGDDETGNGSKENPYKTIEKAMEKVTIAHNGNLYIKKGNYNVSTYFTLDTVGGNLTINGYDGTVVIDMCQKNDFCLIKEGSNVTFKNIKFINGKTTYKWKEEGIFNSASSNTTFINCTFMNNAGYYYIIQSKSVIINCIFINNTAEYGMGEVYGSSYIYNSTFYGSDMYSINFIEESIVDSCTFIDNARINLQYSKLKSILNSKFINNTDIAIKLYQSYALINNCTFINSSSNSIQSSEGHANITNCKFINNSGVNKAAVDILSGSVFYLENNTVINSKSPNYVYSRYGKIISKIEVVILDNKTIETERFGAYITAEAFDDNGNKIAIDYISFTLNGEEIGRSSLSNSQMVLNYKKLLNGTYVVNASSKYLSNFTVKTATLKITPLINKDIYVDIGGSDENGNGSKNNPYRTFDKAISEAITYNNNIYIGEGLFNISSPLEIVTSGGNLTIVGSGHKTIIDLNRSGRFIDSISADSNVAVKNITIANGYKTANGGSILSSGNLTVDNVLFINSSSTRQGGVIYNSGNLIVINSRSINSSSNSQGGVIYNNGYLYLKNNTVINSTASEGNYIFTSGAVDGLILTFNNNGTYVVNGSFKVNATVTDDMGHPITATASNENLLVRFTLDGIVIGTAYLKDGVATSTISSLALDGVYVLSGMFGTSSNVVVKTGTLKFNNTIVLNDVWVSTAGSDLSGNGSKNNPFATLSKALSVVSSVNGVIHVLNGNYIFTDVVKISNKFNLTIKGEGDNVIFNGTYNSRFFEIDSSSSVNLDNLKLVEGKTGLINMGYFRIYEGAIVLNKGILNINKCVFDDMVGVFDYYYTGNIEGLVISNTGTLSIYNSEFKNINFTTKNIVSNLYGLVIHNKNNPLNIYNTTFANNYYKHAKSGLLIYSNHALNLVNSTIVNNVNSCLIYVKGKITVSNSLFKDNNGRCLNSGSNSYITVKESRFINNTCSQGIIYTQGNTVIFNNIFDSNNGSNIYGIIQSSAHLSVYNNIFKNNIANIGSVAYVSNPCVFSIYNNTLINNKATSFGNYIYIGSGVLLNGSKYTLVINSNSSLTIQGNSLYLNATLVDAEGNGISSEPIIFTLNGTEIGETEFKDGFAKINLKFTGEGKYILSGIWEHVLNEDDLKLFTGEIIVRQIESKVIYVDILGNDTTGDGSEDNPYQSLSKALNAANARNNTVYIKPGVYTGSLNSGLSVDLPENTSLQIIGLSNNWDKVIFDNITSKFISLNSIKDTNSSVIIRNIDITNYSSEILFNFNNLDVILDSISIVNSSSSGEPIIQVSFGNCILSNIDMINSTSFSYLGGSWSSNNINYNCTIYNSNFRNSTAYVLVTNYFKSITIINSTFENSTFTNRLLQLPSSLVKIYNSTFRNLNINYGGIQASQAIIEGSIFENIKASSGSYVLFPSCLNMSYSVINNITNLLIAYISDSNFLFNANNNWWGTNDMNSIFSRINGLHNITSWIILDLNNSDIKVGDNITIKILFKSSNGKELDKAIPTRLVELIANGAIFNNGLSNITVDLSDNYLTVNALANSPGNITVKVDNQLFILNITKYNTTLSASNITASYGNVVFNVTVLGDNSPANGAKVIATIDGKNYTAISENGIATFKFNDLDAGKYNITYTVVGDDTYETSAGNATINIEKANSAISLDIKNIDVGEDAVITATVSSGASGNVTFTVNGKNITAIISNGKAILTVKNLTSNTYSVSATYNGDSNYLSSTAATSFKVKLVSFIIIVVSDVFVGDDVVIRAILPSNATGNLVFIVNAKQEKVTINDGVATLTVKNLAVDSYTVIAKYEGNDIYSSSENNTSFSVNKKDTSVDVFIGDFVYGDEIKGTVKLTTIPDNATISDTVVITVNNKNYTVNVINGKANFTIDKLEAGKYNLTVKYKGNKNYTNSYNSYLINIKKATITNNNITVITNYNNLTVNVDLPADAAGNITVNIDGKTYSAIVKDGKTTININNLENKQYDLNIIYSGSDNYNPLTKNTKVTINDNRVILISSNVVMYYKDGTRYIVKLTDIKGNPLANQTVTINIHGMTYNRTTDKEGKASLGLNLAPGFYPVNVLFKGTNTYAKANTSTNVTIKSTINGDNIVKIYKNATQYYATFLNSDGTQLTNKNVTFNIYGVFYKRPTNNMGVARLNINLHPGKYIITAIHPDNGQMFSNNITVLSSINGKNIVKHYRNGTQYYATFLNSDGTPLANRNVTFNIYGVFYTRTTNNMGVAKLNINLHPGKYIITAIHPDNGQMFSNNIKVLPTLVGKDLTKVYGTSSPYEVRLVDGKGLPISGASIRLNIYGVFYNRLTDTNGTARLNINLMPGEYIVTAYYKDTATSNTIRVTN